MSARTEYLKLINERISDTELSFVIEWINNTARRPAVLSFTEGPARQLAYAIEAMLAREKTTAPCVQPLTLRPTERCPRCEFTQLVK